MNVKLINFCSKKDNGFNHKITGECKKVIKIIVMLNKL